MEEKRYLMQKEYNPVASLKQHWDSFISDVENAKERDFAGFETDLLELNKALNGLKGLIALGGLPGVGKTTMALQLGLSVVKNENIPLLYYSLDMTKEDIMAKLFSNLSKIPYSFFKTKNIHNIDNNKFDRYFYVDYQNAKEAVTKYYDKIFISSPKRTEISPVKVRSQATNVKQLSGSDRIFIVIDNIEKFPFDSDPNETPNKYDTLITALKEMQMELNACMLIVSQKTAQSYKDYERGVFAKGTPAIEYKCDAGLMLIPDLLSKKDSDMDDNNSDGNKKDSKLSKKSSFQDYINISEHDFNSSSKKGVDLMIIKNRFGIKGKLHLTFDPELCRFSIKT